MLGRQGIGRCGGVVVGISTRAEPVSGYERRRGDAIAAGAGLVVVLLGMVAVRNGSVSGPEEAAFSSLNDLPGALYPLAWPFQQLGALVFAPVVAIVALVLRRYRLAAAVLVAMLGKLALERIVKAIVSRQRPGTSIGLDIETRGDVSIRGESFVSGHALLVTALAGLVAPYLPRRWRVAPWAVAAVVLLARVYVGAHNPLDVICGGALGVALASCLNLAFGVPRRRRS
jgi:membrane-associated phospholipid phosphatase